MLFSKHSVSGDVDDKDIMWYEKSGHVQVNTCFKKTARIFLKFFGSIKHASSCKSIPFCETYFKHLLLQFIVH